MKLFSRKKILITLAFLAVLCVSPQIHLNPSHTAHATIVDPVNPLEVEEAQQSGNVNSIPPQPEDPSGCGLNPLCWVGKAVTGIGTAIMGIIGDLMAYVAYFINYIINLIFSLFIALFGIFIDIGLQLNRDILQSEFVTKGFGISLSLANLGFVLAIILIAFTTILRLEEYETKKLLRNLVIAAVLVNFSFLITGFFLDIAGVLSDFFIKGSVVNSVGGATQYSAALANALSLSSLQKPVDPAVSAGLLSAGVGLLGNFFNLVAGLFFNVLFNVLLLVAIAGISIMMFIRYIIVSFLLIVMPLAWLFWVIPSLQNQWKEWWHMFIKWTLFMPAMLFFLYLTINTIKSISPGIPKSPDAIANALVGNTSFIGNIMGAITGSISTFAQMFLAVGMILGGLIMANKIGIMGSETAMNAAKWAGGKAVSKMGRQVDKKLPQALTFGKAPKGTLASGVLAKGLNRFRNVPVVGELAARGAAGLEKLASEKHEVEEAQHDLYAPLSNDSLAQVAKGALPSDPARLVGLVSELTKRKMLDKLTESNDKDENGKYKQMGELASKARLAVVADAAKDANPGTKAEDIETIKNILDMNPHLAADLGHSEYKKNADGTDNRDELTRKVVSKVAPSKVADWSKDAFTKSARYMSQAQVSFALRNAGEEKVEELRKQVTTVASEGMDEDMGQVIKTIEELRPKYRRARDMKSPEAKQLQAELKAAYQKEEAAIQKIRDRISAAKAENTEASKKTEKRLLQQLASIENLRTLSQKAGWGEYGNF